MKNLGIGIFFFIGFLILYLPYHNNSHLDCPFVLFFIYLTINSLDTSLFYFICSPTQYYLCMNSMKRKFGIHCFQFILTRCLLVGSYQTILKFCLPIISFMKKEVKIKLFCSSQLSSFSDTVSEKLFAAFVAKQTCEKSTSNVLC